jgi:hypothetical protein
VPCCDSNRFRSDKQLGFARAVRPPHAQTGDLMTLTKTLISPFKTYALGGGMHADLSHRP